MNRLILIGNGFDLAHGLKTSYKDFIFWYLDECFNSAGIYANGQRYSDTFLDIEVSEHYRLMDLVSKAKGKGISRYLYENNVLSLYLSFSPTENSSDAYYERFSPIFNTLAHKTYFKSLFFKKLIETCLEFGWVDIEQEYFDQLKSFRDSDNRFDYNKVNTLNKDLDYLKAKLEEYLIKEEDNRKININEDLLDIINSSFEVRDFDTNIDVEKFLQDQLIDIVNVQNSNKLYVLNFNYTNSFYPYLQELLNTSNSYSDIDENHIHGQLNNPNNPIIFGFGDEHDKEYLLFEEHNINSLFEHVKSYHYLKTPNYRNLIRFLNEEFYQVLVVGHSCGLSDRTMFKEIFDHENCKSVKILHHKRSDGNTDFFDKTINLGRHFTDKGRMRKLIVNFNEADSIPQFEK